MKRYQKKLESKLYNSDTDDLSQRSNTINILITDCLAYIMLFSLIFLHDNKLIVDIDTETVVNKHNEYDVIIFGSQKTLQQHL